MFYQHQFTHSYPHDWRGKSPVIFRATEQWFVGVDTAMDNGMTLRAMARMSCGSIMGGYSLINQEHLSPNTLALRALLRDDAVPDDASGRLHYLTDIAGKHFPVDFIPVWGRNRMDGMVQTRPDWCLSRQRSWGLPIPAFYPPLNEDGDPLLTEASVKAVAQVIREEGSDAWFVLDADQLLRHYDPEVDPEVIANERLQWVLPKNRRPQHPIEKSSDIFDVWFESGSSWHAAIRQRFGDEAYPADLYLEGSDQHRGWFQLSLLPALGVTGQAPFRGVLTHGFMVDKDGRKMSKSLGNTLEVEDLLKNYGADVCRWWVASLNTDNDIKVDRKFFDVAGDEYRKVRNTIRFILSNLGDFSMKSDKVRFEDEDARSIDAWATRELIRLSDRVTDAYDKFQFRKAHEALFNFCNDTMSATYLAAVKDRLYCNKPDDRVRRRTQSTLYRIADVLTRLLAPILPHTADEAWAALQGEDAECVHLLSFADVDCMRQIPVSDDWDAAIAQRDKALKTIEDARQSMDIDNPLALGLRVSRDNVLAKFDTVDIADLCGISRVEFVDGDGVLEAVDLRDEPACERSWKRDGTVKQRDDGGMLSDRDAAALGMVD